MIGVQGVRESQRKGRELDFKSLRRCGRGDAGNHKENSTCQMRRTCEKAQKEKSQGACRN